MAKESLRLQRFAIRLPHLASSVLGPLMWKTCPSVDASS
jgi:hypothetical protein